MPEGKKEVERQHTKAEDLDREMEKLPVSVRDQIADLRARVAKLEKK